MLQVILIFHASNTTFMKFDIFKCQGVYKYIFELYRYSKFEITLNQFECFLNIEN